jgi:hypothetical protein
MTRWAIIAAAATLAGVLATPPAKAAEWPWCADYGGGGRGGTTNCGFASWEQCQINIRGIGGWCYRNPYYAPRQRRDRRHR